MDEDAVARAIACFERSQDIAFLREVLRAIRPKAEAVALRAEKQGRPLPPPLPLEAAPRAAAPAEALATVRSTRDFAQLQAMARAAGRRAEALAGSG